MTSIAEPGTDQRVPLHVEPPSRSRLTLRFVSMPWAPLELPSMAISLLGGVAERHPGVERVETDYLNLAWAEHVHERSGGRWGAAEYEEVVGGYFVGMGDWIFSAYFRPALAAEDTAYWRLVHRSEGTIAEHAAAMYGWARGFVEEQADRLAASVADVDSPMFGFTTTFDQNMASLALAAALKTRRPDAVVVFGGANCDGEQGPALHRNFGFVDFVVGGEAEESLPRLLTALSVDGDERVALLRQIPGLCWRRHHGSVANPPQPRQISLAAAGRPKMDAFYAAFDRSPHVRSTVVPKMQLEGSRGCWWGEKHHCTFCGLNGTGMRFRARDPHRFVSDLRELSSYYHSLDAVFTDNILDMAVVNKAASELAQLDLDFQLFAEVKSNLRFRQLEVLSRAGFTQLQPGIESLLSPVLRLMRKGVSAWQNVRFLRDAATVGIYPGWNLLFGFPGETDAAYLELIEQLPLLHHLVPPEGTYRIVMTRFSPYFENPELGLRSEGPSALLSAAYGLPRREMADLVYVYDSARAGIGNRTAAALGSAIKQWKRMHRSTRLHVTTAHGRTDVIERRGGSRRVLELSEDETTILRRAAPGLNVDQLAPGERAVLDELIAARLIFVDGAHAVALPVGLTW